MPDKPTPTDAELNTILCAHWPAFAMQSTLVKIWVRDALQDAIDKWGQPAQAAEPVSHQYQSKDGTWRGFMDQLHYNQTVASGGWPIRALYTAPQPVARAPLTDEQREAIWQECRHDNGEGWEVDCWEVIDAVERMHGIKEASYDR